MIHPINMPADFMAGAPPTADDDAEPRRGRQPTDAAVENVAAETLFPKNSVHTRPTVTYTADGRRIRDGEPTTPLQSPEKLWGDVIVSKAMGRVKKNSLEAAAVDVADGSNPDSTGSSGQNVTSHTSTSAEPVQLSQVKPRIVDDASHGRMQGHKKASS